jgi:uncharacterized membrane protein YdjX (TVP38/TMEM64 family)
MDTKDQPRPAATAHPVIRIVAVVFLLALLFAIFKLSGLRDHFSLGFLQQKLSENRISGLIIFVLIFSLGNLIQIPGWIFLAAAVLTLGRTWGAAATYVAAIISCSITFFTIRFLGGNVLRQIKNKIAIRLLEKLDSHPVGGIILLRVLFQTIPALNYALAMSGVKFREYLIGTMLGLPLPIALYCIFFNYLAKIVKLA